MLSAQVCSMRIFVDDHGERSDKGRRELRGSDACWTSVRFTSFRAPQDDPAAAEGREINPK